MKAKGWAWALGALLVASAAAVAAADDNARKKGGGGGSAGGGSESAGARHHSGGSGRSGGEVRSGGEARSGGGGERSVSVGSQRDSSSGSRGRSSREGDDPPVRRVSGAEARHPEAGTGHGWRDGRYGTSSGRPYSRYGYSSYGYGYPYYGYGRPYYWGWYGIPFYGGYWSSWDSPYWGVDYGSGYYDRYRYRYRETGSIRTLVDPERTKVFVDGYYAGTVDDFDGMFQRLYVAPGRHDISFQLDGYRTHRVKVYVTTDQTVKIRHDMARGAGDETLEDLSDGREDPPYRLSAEEPERDAYARREDERAPRDARELRDAGTLRLDVRPADASIYVDGEFHGTARRTASLSLPPGRHRIEVVRPGHRTVEREVEVQPGKTETLSIDLEKN